MSAWSMLSPSTQTNRVQIPLKNLQCNQFGRPGLVVMGGDSCSEGRGFESQHNILDGHFSHTFAVKIVMFEKTKINKKDAEDGPFF